MSVTTTSNEVKDSIESEMLMSINERAMSIGVLDVPFQDDSSDLGSWVIKESHGPCDGGDLALNADLKPGHLFINHKDRGMMMNSLALEHARSTRGACGGSSPDVRFTNEPRIGCEPSEAMLSALWIFRSGQFEGWDAESEDGTSQDGTLSLENCCYTFMDDYHSPLRSRSYRSGGTTQQIASALIDDCVC